MTTALVIAASTAGALAGLATPVPAYRLSVELDEPALATCGSCGSPLPSPVSLRASCASCGTRLGASRWWTVPAGALSFGALAWAIPDRPPVLLAALVLATLALPLAAIDLAVLRLPDPLVLICAVTTGVLLVIAAATEPDWAALLRAAEAGAGLFVLYFVLAILPGATFGLGDVKLGAVIGLLLGYLGWGAVILGVTLPWLANVPFAVTALIRKGRGAEQPFGPALLAGSLLAVVVSAALRG